MTWRALEWLESERPARWLRTLSEFGTRRREELFFSAAVLTGALVAAAVRGAWLTR